MKPRARSAPNANACRCRSNRSLLALITLLIFLPLFPLAAVAQTPTNTPLGSPELEKRVNALLAKMTLEEKIGQLVQYSAGAGAGPGSGRTDDRDMIRKGQIGSLFNVTGARATNELQHIAVEESRLHVPLIFGLDVIHGYRTTFPLNLGLAATWDPSIVEKASRVAAQEASAAGVRWTFSPMVDIARDARWGRMSEGSGEDPFLGAALARAYVRGYQGERLDAPGSIVACAKHYVGYGAAEAGRDYNTTEISEHTLRQNYLPPFHAAEEAGAATFMSAFNSINGIPASANPFTLKQILKKEWGFRGFVVSDWTSVSEIMAHGIAIDGATAARKALVAGVDMDMQSNLYHRNMLQLVQSGKVPQSAIDEAVRRILRVKFAIGLFDRPYTDESKESAAMLRPGSLAIEKTAATRSLVLLRNESVSGSPLLPLSAANTSSVALIGPLADDAGNMIGSWGGLGRGEDAVSLRRALAQKLGDSRVRYAKGTSFLEGSDAEIAAAVSAAQSSDVAVLALGEDAPRMTGEAASRAFLGLPGRQQELLEKVVATGKPVVLILFSGRPLTLPWAFEHVPAVLAAWYPGLQAGNALTDILFGDAAPTGHLPLSWPRSVGQEPLYYNALNTGRPAADPDHPAEKGETKYVSRYIDEQNTPQFPFGFGLTYTTFRYGNTQASVKELPVTKLRQALAAKGKKVVTVSADIANTGSRAGEAMAQLYVRLDGTSIAMPVRMLKGFQGVTLAPGETRKVTFEVDAETFAFWGADNTFGVEPARVTLWIAPSSAEGEPATLNITER